MESRACPGFGGGRGRNQKGQPRPCLQGSEGHRDGWPHIDATILIPRNYECVTSYGIRSFAGVIKGLGLEEGTLPSTIWVITSVLLRERARRTVRCELGAEASEEGGWTLPAVQEERGAGSQETRGARCWGGRRPPGGTPSSQHLPDFGT